MHSASAITHPPPPCRRAQFNSTYPIKCFNAFKNWQLGWYASNQLTINPLARPRRINLVAFADYPTAGRLPVIVNVGGVYFLQFNRAKTINIDSGEKINKLTVTRNDENLTQSVAGLDVGQSYEVANWQGSNSSLVIQVCRAIYNVSNPAATDRMVISVGLGRSVC
jgi:hypothetical protein